MFRFAMGTGRRFEWWPVRAFHHHRLQPCLALWQRALAFLSLLALPYWLRPMPAASHQRPRLHSSILLLPAGIASPWLRDAAEAAASAHPPHSAGLPAVLPGPLLVIARRRSCGAFMHAHEGEVGYCRCGRR